MLLRLKENSFVQIQDSDVTSSNNPKNQDTYGKLLELVLFNNMTRKVLISS